jgi:hypothetical protein
MRKQETQDPQAAPETRRKKKVRRPPKPPDGGVAVEAVQTPPTQEEVTARLKAERVQLKLQALPSWMPVLEGRAIQRVHAFPEAHVAAWYAGYLSHYAAAMKVPATVSLSGRQVSVTLHGPVTRSNKGELNDSVLDFALQLA